MKQLSIYLLMIFLVAGCNQKSEQSSQEDTDVKEVTEVNFASFGADVEAVEAMSLTDLSIKMQEDTAVSGAVEITIEDVCQMKGCWMTAKLPDGKEMRITFKDYGFFVPKDANGKTAVIEGLASIKEIQEDVLKHYAEESGKPQDQIDQISGPSNEITFVATGVKIYDADSE